jgi:hypothetical protein
MRYIPSFLNPLFTHFILPWYSSNFFYIGEGVGVFNSNRLLSRLIDKEYSDWESSILNELFIINKLISYK